MKCFAFTWVGPRWVWSLSFRTSLDVCIPTRIPKCRRGPPGRPFPSLGRSHRSAPCATPWTWWCLWGGSPWARPQLSVERFAERSDHNGGRWWNWCELCDGRSLTVTPAMTGAFPSISLNTSASASSPVFSLYFLRASSPSATLNSSNVMVRQDFFLESWSRRRLEFKFGEALLATMWA